MTAPEPIVIAGASLTGAKAAEALRSLGFDGGILLVGEEDHRPYERPPLSKGYLRGDEGLDKVYVHDDGFYDANSIELRTGTRVADIDAPSRMAVLEDGERIPYHRLLLATGAEPRRLHVPGSELEGVYTLRELRDADVLRARLDEARRLVVVGGGWIGAEVAASARQKGVEVVMVEMSSFPLERVLGPELGALYRDIHVEHGVELIAGSSVAAFEGTKAVERVRTSDGQIIECDLAVLGVGVAPRLGLAHAAGLAVEDGVAVDEHLETSVPGIFAAGDVASAWHPFYGRRIRVEHWANAKNQGQAVAASMIGRRAAYDRLPYFFSDQYDVGMEYSGYATTWDEVVFRGDPEQREFSAFWLQESRVVAGMNVNVWDVVEPIQHLIRSRSPIDVARLTDPDVPLADLVPPVRRGDR